MLSNKPCQSWPALEVNNVVLPILFGQCLARGFTGESNGNVEAPK